MGESISYSQPPSENGSEPSTSIRLGLVSTASGVEATQSEFYFWADRAAVPESGQIVYAQQTLPANNLGISTMTVYAVIERVNRLSGARSVEADMRERDGDASKGRLWPRGSGTDRTGTTYAYCRVIGIQPSLLTPLREDTEVFLASETEAGQGYNYPEMQQAGSSLSVGVLLNGGVAIAGKACLDTRYMLGEFGGHVNVTGKAGTGTKTSFLLNLIKHLMLYAEDATKRGSPLYLVPIVFNAKGSDLMWIKYPNKDFSAGSFVDYEEAWSKSYWERYATPFGDAKLYSYPDKGALRQGLPEGTQPYSWALRDVIEWGTWRYLFSGEDRSQDLLMGVLFDAFQQISKRDTETMSGYTLDTAIINNFEELIDWLNQGVSDDTHYLRTRSHSPMTIEAAVRRLRNAITSSSVLLSNQQTGKPPLFAKMRSLGPIVIDIDGLSVAAQRFVVASIIEYLKTDRRTNAAHPQVYVLMLDELNQYVGRSNHDEIARLFEHVAAQLRSQGILLFGAQQKASDVNELVFENCATKVLGNTGSGEIGQAIWARELSEDARSRALQLSKDEKLVLQDGFRYPMALKFPLNPWATRAKDAVIVPERDLFEEEMQL